MSIAIDGGVGILENLGDPAFWLPASRFIRLASTNSPRRSRVFKDAIQPELASVKDRTDGEQGRDEGDGPQAKIKTTTKERVGGGGSRGSGRAWWWWFLILGCLTEVVAVGCGGRGGGGGRAPVAAVIEFGAFEGST
ncbi:hypothetical protein NL676_003994 [Syzygium grande]|nr:hypothetical protein NL676_003994 [Syzygium grande]